MGNRTSRKEGWSFKEKDLELDGFAKDRSVSQSCNGQEMDALRADTTSPRVPKNNASDGCGCLGMLNYKHGAGHDDTCAEGNEDSSVMEAGAVRRLTGGADASVSGRDDAFEAAADLLLKGHYVVAFTGAGISVDSGIPDFRSPSGLWARFDPRIYCSYPAFHGRPHLFWTMAVEMHRSTGVAAPNRGHSALVELEALVGLKCVITQNVDALHQRAGSSVVHELHGSVCTMTCVACKQQRPVWDDIERLSKLDKKELEPSDVPRCSVCVNPMKMDVVLFGEALPYAVLQEAMRAANMADVILVVGTSLTVAPACSLVQQCKSRGGAVIVCNLDDSGQSYADVVLQGEASDTLERLADACRQQVGETRAQLEQSLDKDKRSPASSKRTLASRRAGSPL